MTLLRDIASELVGMFLADAKLSGAILLLVAAVAYLVDMSGMITPLVGGAALLVGCLLILVSVAVFEARRHPK